MRILGLDLGDKRIGVAISDPQQILAIPLTIILRDKEEKVIEMLKELIHQYQIERIVVGLPRSLRGNMGREAEKAQTFINWLSGKINIPVDTWDEWLSSVAAERQLKEVGVKRNQRKARRDALAAAFILQGYLDHQHQTTFRKGNDFSV